MSMHFGVPRRAVSLLSAALVGSALLVVGAGGASAATDRFDTGVTVNPLKAACEVNAPTCDHVGTTNGYFNGENVKLLYSQDFFCDKTVASKAATGCEAGGAYKKLPPGTAKGAVDPLYIPVPLFTKPAVHVQCQAKPMCIDHPATVDLSALSGALGAPKSALYDAMLPGHDHIIATRNEDKPEWWPVVVVGVTSAKAWTTITKAKDYATMKGLEGKTGSGVTGEIPTNVFLWFQTLPGHITAGEAATNSTAVPAASANGKAIDNLKKDCATSATGCNNANDYLGQTHAWLGDAGTAQGSNVNLLYSSPFFCDASVQKAGANACEAGQKYAKVPGDITSDKYVDPLYIPTPLFKQPVNDLQCPSGKPCIDHPMTADLSRLATTLGAPASALKNFMIPGHDHILTTRNNDRPEWWTVTVIGVTKPASFAKITQAHSYAEVKKLEADPANGVLEVPTNIFLFFQTVPGAGVPTATYMSMPVGAPNTGGGSTAGFQHQGLLELGLLFLLAGGGALTLSRRRPRIDA